MAALSHKGRSVFCDKGAFHQLLSAIGKDRSSPDREMSAFVARNFQLDERVSLARGETYATYQGTPNDLATWRARHQLYLEREVFVSGDEQASPAHFDTSDPHLVPDTFRSGWDESPFARVDAPRYLIRMMPVSDIAAISRHGEPAHLLKTAERSLGGDSVAAKELDGVLADLAGLADRRPVFAGFFEDADDLFGDAPDGDAPDWPDRLRNRLGLLHYAPMAPGETIPVFVFRYPVRLIPTTPGSGAVRPLVPPCVLDGGLSAAFVPSPVGEWTGYTIHLGDTQDPSVAHRREVLHPTVQWTRSHLFRVGVLRLPVSQARLADARGLHILEVREASGRHDFAVETDGDLLT